MGELNDRRDGNGEQEATENEDDQQLDKAETRLATRTPSRDQDHGAPPLDDRDKNVKRRYLTPVLGLGGGEVVSLGAPALPGICPEV
jgi:hypothetical protein